MKLEALPESYSRSLFLSLDTALAYWNAGVAKKRLLFELSRSESFSRGHSSAPEIYSLFKPVVESGTIRDLPSLDIDIKRAPKDLTETEDHLTILESSVLGPQMNRGRGTIGKSETIAPLAANIFCKDPAQRSAISGWSAIRKGLSNFLAVGIDIDPISRVQFEEYVVASYLKNIGLEKEIPFINAATEMSILLDSFQRDICSEKRILEHLAVRSHTLHISPDTLLRTAMTMQDIRQEQISYSRLSHFISEDNFTKSKFGHLLTTADAELSQPGKLERFARSVEDSLAQAHETVPKSTKEVIDRLEANFLENLETSGFSSWVEYLEAAHATPELSSILRELENLDFDVRIYFPGSSAQGILRDGVQNVYQTGQSSIGAGSYAHSRAKEKGLMGLSEHEADVISAHLRPKYGLLCAKDDASSGAQYGDNAVSLNLKNQALLNRMCFTIGDSLVQSQKKNYQSFFIPFKYRAFLAPFIYQYRQNFGKKSGMLSRFAGGTRKIFGVLSYGKSSTNGGADIVPNFPGQTAALQVPTAAEGRIIAGLSGEYKERDYIEVQVLGDIPVTAENISGVSLEASRRELGPTLPRGIKVSYSR